MEGKGEAVVMAGEDNTARSVRIPPLEDPSRLVCNFSAPAWMFPGPRRMVSVERATGRVPNGPAYASVNGLRQTGAEGCF